MVNLINNIENWFIKMWFYFRVTFYFREWYKVNENIKDFTFNLEKSDLFNTSIVPHIGKLPAYLHKDEFGEQWLKPNWNPSIPKYDTMYPWGGKIEDVDLSDNDPGLVVPTNTGLHFGCVGNADNKEYKHSLIYSNFTVGPSFAIDFIGKASPQHGVITAFWVASLDGVFEMDAVEYMGEWKNAFTATLHNGNSYGKVGHWRSKNNRIKHWKYKPTEKYYNYRVINDVDRGVCKFYINGYLIRKFHRTTTAPCHIICGVGVWKHTSSSFITEAILDSVIVYERNKG